MDVLVHEASRVPNSYKEVETRPSAEHGAMDLQSNDQPPEATRIPQRQPVDIIFEDISYTVSLGFGKGVKEILHRVNGRLPAGELIAIMGPSGAGKSTLLDVLSGYRITGVEGTVFVNGRVRNMNVFHRSSAYITQDDRLQPLLTVIENIRIAANLKISTNTPIYAKEAIIEEILTKLGLYTHMHTRAGRLSGGQKKRLSIALELVNNPLVMFLDEPTTGLDSSSCTQVVKLLQLLARQGRTIVCTIHQPSASLFQLFDQVYVLARGACLYQGAASLMVPFLESVKLPCPVYHNPADYVIELACAEYGQDKIDALVWATQNGKSLQWFTNPDATLDTAALRAKHPLKNSGIYEKKSRQETSQYNQIKVLLQRGYLKTKRDTTLTHLRIAVNIFTGVMLGTLFIRAGNEGSRVLDNYNLLFAILMHHMMTTMMLTILTFPNEMNILKKEHFNRWYSLRSYYISVTLVDIPVSVFCCLLFSVIVYLMSAQPLEISRFSMFVAISLLVAFVAQSFGLMIGAVFGVVNGTFMGPTLSVPMMMFAGFGVTLHDLPAYLKWGSYISYLRYGLEGYVSAIYGLERKTLACGFDEVYCHFKYPRKFLMEIAMDGDQFWFDICALGVILLFTRLSALLLLRWKLMASR
ncbi:ATP-binding cassette subfamily G member 4 isoform X1 [Neodiprion fabricii]|uniref:ATP-binding cassette subfamily G member 4 isoform X1 n=1 Tax=Neodiprion fabricii TaxID=2872261 RepID=UPI001ED8CBED|nr:ATP-binding cassette subfamily G member 4 isoform X1 [Neodiprion fabricii]XP_046414958.1 ATP-binding cassette subfamily G member 4 isoform X1 [Neodiprion fabricii]